LVDDSSCVFVFVTELNVDLRLLLLGVCDDGPGALADSKGVSDDDKMLNCLEHVSYAKVFT
jgi:hypothetical protein